MDLDIQIKLLRLLENKSFCRVGSTEEIKVDIQFLAATNKNLEEVIKLGKFREDLYYRLNTFSIKLPPLRERKGDIPLLANYFLAFYRKLGKTKCESISKETMEYLNNYHWPGNVRELKSCIERAIIYANYKNHKEILPDDLPFELIKGSKDLNDKLMINIPEEGVNIDEKLAIFELAHIEEALKKCDGKKSEAWKLLGYNDRFALRRRIKRIIKTFPYLIDKFPYIKAKYGK